jgi:Glycosyltransferase family 87
MTGRQRALLFAVALGLRLLPVLVADREVADVLRYRKVADHVLDVSWNPYEAPRLFPYPPVWVWVEAGAGLLARRLGLSFPILVKLPVLLADLGIVWWLARWGRRRHASLVPAWIYALHPVAVLVGAFHGQFDAVALFFVLLAISAWWQGRRDGSALALSAAVALKSFPILLLPVLLVLSGQAARDRIRYAALVVGPVLLLLLPYAADNPVALRRELFGYGGVADFGWIALVRGLRWLSTGVLARSEAAFWGGHVFAAKALFLAAYAGLLAAIARGRLGADVPRTCLCVLLAFLVSYGAISAQYLLWVVPLGALTNGRVFAIYSAAATVALCGFYAFLAPGVLWAGPDPGWLGRQAAGMVWVAGVAAVLAASGAWLLALLRQVEPA